MLSQSLAVTAQELKRVDKMTLQLQGSCIQRWEVIEYIKKKREKKRKVEVLEYFERLSTWRSEGKLHLSKASTHLSKLLTQIRK